MQAFELRWSHGKARVLTTAAMLAECTFILPSGPFSPFARAPWMGTVTDPAITGHLRELGGDFPCLPFGIGRDMPGAPPDWAPLLLGPTQGPVHGPAADRDWQVVSASETSITLALDYDDPSPVLRIERSLTARPGVPALDSTLTIHARRPARISAGLHPILRLPDRPGRLHLSARFTFGLVHPGYGGQEFAAISEVPRPGGALDLSHVPLSPRRDINAQLCGVTSPLTATFLDEGAGLEIDWDRSLLPSLQIWHTDASIKGPPWHGQYRGIGLEPIASAFDLDTSVSAAPNPISRRGVPTALNIDPAAPVTLRHSFRAFPI